MIDSDWKKHLIIERSGVINDLYGIYSPDRNYFYFKSWKRANDKAKYAYFLKHEIDHVLAEMKDPPPSPCC